MKKRKLSSKDIPDEFQISAYDVCATWGLKEWATALSVRLDIRQEWRWGCLEGKDEQRVPEKMMQAIREATRKMLNNPFDADLSIPLATAHRSPIRDQSPNDYFDARGAYRDPRYQEWIDRANYVDHGDYDSNNENYIQELTIETRKFEDTPAWKMHADCSDAPHSLFIAVDLGASDDYLIKEFKKWIKKTRKEIGVKLMPRAFNSTDFTTWHEQRLLPYLDFDFWAETHGITFSLPVFGEKLFPEKQNSDVDELVRKTIGPKARAIVTEEVVSALNTQLRLSPKK